MKYLIVVFILALTVGCTKELTVDQIIDKSIDAYGGQKVYNSSIEFDFRKIHYLAKYHNHKFTLQRTINDSTGLIIDKLTNEGFSRTVNDSLVVLDEEWTGKYSRSVNSVVYFFRIPFVLKDGAVNPELLGSVKINDKNYYKVRVSFSEEGGGEDFDDSFIYWINDKDFHIDYLAYSYSTDGGGKRFREAISPRTINGFYTVDFINYKPNDMGVAIEDYDTYFLEGGMKELSRIENENISVQYLE